VGIQGFVLEAWCQYCLTSAGLSTLICAFVWIGSRRVPDSEADSQPSDDGFTEKV
jgi:hypothetical protein